MSERDRLVSAMSQNYDNLDALLGSLSDDDFAVQSLCPDWTVRGVMTHLGAAETMLAGWTPESGDDPVPFDRIRAFVAEAEGLSHSALLDRYRAVVDRRRDEVAALSDADLARPSMTPVGPGTVGRFLAIRCFDYWVHEHDIRMPLARPSDDGGLTAEVALSEIHRSLGYIVGKLVALPDQMSLTFHLTGPLTTDLHVRVDGRAGVVEHLDEPDVEVTLHSTSFIMLACGRIDPDSEIDAGRARWKGKPGSLVAEIGERAVRNLGFTM